MILYLQDCTAERLSATLDVIVSDEGVALRKELQDKTNYFRKVSGISHPLLTSIFMLIRFVKPRAFSTYRAVLLGS